MTDEPEPQVDIVRVGDAQGRGGLYNLLFPQALERAAMLLPLIDLNPDSGGAFRLRDAWVERWDGQPVVRVYTRIGGGNREAYAEVIGILRGHRLYIKDEDDTLDSTYASFYFRAPSGLIDMLSEVAVDPVDMAEAWRLALAHLR